jgi:glycosyltransferase involved in cell wall biosynthesis
LLFFHRPKGKIVITVHDIIPYMLRNDPELTSYRTVAHRVFDRMANRMAMAGLKRSNLLVADSEYTKCCVVEQLGIAPEKIEVVYLGIELERFKPLPVPDAIRERYRLSAERRYLIYVGSEDPRKNLVTLVRALAEVRHELPDVELIKVGRAFFDQERQRLIDLADQFEIRSAIHFLDDVPEDDLPLLYNLADVCVMPSLYEGFGFPVLEAQACGTPVVCLEAGSLPEVLGDAGLPVRCVRGASDALAAAIISVLTQSELRHALEQKSPVHAATFTWSRTVRQMLDIYQSIDA